MSIIPLEVGEGHILLNGRQSSWSRPSVKRAIMFRRRHAGSAALI